MLPDIQVHKLTMNKDQSVRQAQDKKKKILIVEDEISLLNALKDEFERAGFLVFVAKNGMEGLHNALTHHPDFVLLDILMPEMDGMEMLRNLRKDPWGQDVPVIMLTNISDAKYISDSMNLKVNEYIVKSDREIEDVVEDVKLILKM